MLKTSAIAIGQKSSLPMLIDLRGVAALLGVCEKSIMRYDARKKIPAPLVLNGTRRWRTRELLAWIDCGCEDRLRWESREHQWAAGAVGTASTSSAGETPGQDQQGQQEQHDAADSGAGPQVQTPQPAAVVAAVPRSSAVPAALPPLRGEAFRKFITSGLTRPEWEAKHQPVA